MEKVKSANELLIEFSEFFLSKNAKENYGNSYLEFGKFCQCLFPKGLTLKTESDFNKAGIFFMQIHKMMRLSKAIFGSGNNFEKPFDNAKDLSIYSAMLAELLLEENGR